MRNGLAFSCHLAAVSETVENAETLDILRDWSNEFEKK